MYAWHFVNKERTLRDGNTVAAGWVYEIEPPLVMCKWGLHAGQRIIDALQYAPGPILCRVRLSGQILRDPDKVVAQRREVLWMLDASNLLHECACQFAERALTRLQEAGDKVDPRSWDAIAAKRKWVAGDIDNEQLAAARAAARAAAWDAARGAARAAARVAARFAPRDAARDAARDAVWDAARAAEREWQESRLQQLVALENT
jgi:hypothetical protein